MKVTYLDITTGQTATDSHISVWSLTEGNWSCDCNRYIPFDYNPPDTDICLGCNRFIVIAVEKEPEDEEFDPINIISEANREYAYKLALP